MTDTRFYRAENGMLFKANRSPQQKTKDRARAVAGKKARRRQRRLRKGMNP